MKKNSLYVSGCQGQRSKVKKTSMVNQMFSLSRSRPIRFREIGNSTNHVIAFFELEEGFLEKLTMFYKV
jgi:hypothetical protein